jgi:hypothetical protein
MWLIALYVPGMAPVNQYFVPPQWLVSSFPSLLSLPLTLNTRIALSIFVIEICTVFIPCWQVQKHQTLRQETLESIANWESKKRFGVKSETSSDKSGSSAPPLSPTSTKVGDYTGFDSWKKLPGLEAGNNNNSSQSNLGPDDSVLTMAALEHVLDKNPEPLRQFSARKDFSGENIAFLTAVSEWKAALPADFSRNRYDATPDAVREQFTRALRIYTEFISPRDAEFPINIAWADLRKLQGIFERAARSTAAANNQSSSVDAATPFADADGDIIAAPAPTQSGPAPPSRDSEMHILKPSTTPTSTKGQHIPLSVTIITPPSTASPLPTYTGDVPQAFDASVFDAAQASIKYLVLTNTWPKYVRERRNSESSSSGSNSSSSGSVRTRNTSRSGSRRAPSSVGGGSVGSKMSLKGALGFLKGVIH